MTIAEEAAFLEVIQRLPFGVFRMHRIVSPATYSEQSIMAKRIILVDGCPF